MTMLRSLTGSSLRAIWPRLPRPRATTTLRLHFNDPVRTYYGVGSGVLSAEERQRKKERLLRSREKWVHRTERVIEPTDPEPDDPKSEPRRLTDETLLPLTEEQNEVVQAVLQGHNVFFTGSAGSGKSLVLKHLHFHLDSNIHITATTGIAAALIGGTTLHRFSGLRDGEKNVDHYLDLLSWRRLNATPWLTTKVLVIDEVSMLDPVFFEKLNEIAKSVRAGLHYGDREQFFGGIQLVLCGDFFQLPPVRKAKDRHECHICGDLLEHTQDVDETDAPLLTGIGIDPNQLYRCAGCRTAWNNSIELLFQSPSWQEGQFREFVLQKVHRQTDQAWINVLERIKFGIMDGHAVRFLEKLTRPLPDVNGIKPTRIYPYRRDVFRENMKEFIALPGKTSEFLTFDSGVRETLPGPKPVLAPLDDDAIQDEPFFTNLPVSPIVELKEGAQVMLLSNYGPPALVNGSRGVIQGYREMGHDEFVEAANTKPKDLVSKYHRLLSIYFHSNCNLTTNTISVPLVSFYSLVREGKTGSTIPVYPHLWVHEVRRFDPKNPRRVAAIDTFERFQIPLTLSWATTVHKSQGMTLDYAQVDVEDAFSHGQVYVALSRVRDPGGLQIMGKPHRLKRACKCHPAVIEFHNDMLKRLGRKPVDVSGGHRHTERWK